MFEATNEPLYMMFLDWSMAFDKLSHVGLTSSLRRFGLPPQFLKVISDIYTNPTFTVLESNNKSTKKPQGSGFRQGCPLSPYLFTIFLTIMMEDVKTTLIDQFAAQNNHNPFHIFSANTPLMELMYADDILLFSRNLDTLHIDTLQYTTIRTDTCTNGLFHEWSGQNGDKTFVREKRKGGHVSTPRTWSIHMGHFTITRPPPGAMLLPRR